MEQLPVADERFDFVSMGYALRHVVDLNATFREFQRVLKPGGVLLILEIAQPTTPLKRTALKFYLGRVIPLLGRLSTGQREMQTLMRYYWDTIENCVPRTPSSRPSAMPVSLKRAAMWNSTCFRAYFGCTRDNGRPVAGSRMKSPAEAGFLQLEA